ncbi:MAG TPA: carbon-nitrogen hydrolase family protein [Gammaproteobacteria bacterium]|nr:carbon-nitrogen hydrolase family protein [Gammaproteobacteria bacterium]
MTERGRFRVSAAQMTSGTDVARNLAEAGRLIASAASAGSALVVLPENFSFMGPSDAERVAVAEAEGDGPAQAFAAEAARKHGIWLVAGTIPIRAGDRRVLSRSLLFTPDGTVAASYDKIHLFDVDLPRAEGESYRESETTRAGARVVSAVTDLGRIAMTVCYDIRFPALFARLAAIGMDVLVVPAAFTVPTGRVHWLPLLKCRAIESLTYVVASGQCGEHPGGRRTYGHSMVIGPWGDVLAECPSGPGIAQAEVDMIELERLRRQFPVLNHRRDLE